MIILQEPVVEYHDYFAGACGWGGEGAFAGEVSHGSTAWGGGQFCNSHFKRIFYHSLEQYSVGQIYENLNIMRY